MGICPHHCPAPSGGGFATAVLTAGGVLVLAAAAGPVVHAAEVIVQVIVITVASLVGLALLAIAALVARRVYLWRARRAHLMAALESRLAWTAEAAQALPAPRKALPAPVPVAGTVLAGGYDLASHAPATRRVSRVSGMSRRASMEGPQGDAG
jgi:hypothetical protein